MVEMVDFQTSAEGLRFTCSNCGKESLLASPGTGEPAPEPKPERAEPVPGEVVCPKCGHSQKDPYACHRCGLVFDKFDESQLPPDPEEAAAMWKELQLMPADEDRHQAFLEACQKVNRLDYAARQYRLMLRQPEHKALAEKMLEELFSKAQAHLAPVTMTGESRREERKKKGRILFWILLAITGGLLIYYIITMTEMLSRMSY
jgi:ribosomal protein S27AE